MAIRLCTFDVDETLLDPAQRIPEVLRDALEGCRRQGVRLSLATGRMFESARPYLEAIRANAPVILYNGARVQDPQTGRICYDRTVDLQEALRALGLVKDAGLHVNLYLDDGIYIEKTTEVSRESAKKDGVVQKPVGDLAAFLKAPPTKLLIIGPGERLEALWRAFDAEPHRAAVVRSEPTYLEILPPGVNKGTALREVSRLTGIPLSDIAAFGDSNNDIEMIREAGLGVAVANALPAVKAAARYVSDLPRSDGVAEAIRKYILGSEPLPEPTQGRSQS
jgi:hypothetical protein